MALLTFKQAMAELGYRSRQSLWSLVNRGEIKPIYLPGGEKRRTIRFEPAEVDRLEHCRRPAHSRRYEIVDPAEPEAPRQREGLRRRRALGCLSVFVGRPCPISSEAWCVNFGQQSIRDALELMSLDLLQILPPLPEDRVTLEELECIRSRRARGVCERGMPEGVRPQPPHRRHLPLADRALLVRSRPYLESSAASPFARHGRSGIPGRDRSPRRTTRVPHTAEPLAAF